MQLYNTLSWTILNHDPHLLSSVVLCLYLPVAISGYVIIGDEVSSNILLDATPGVPITIAISLDIVNLLGTFVICFNPVGQAFEDIIGIKNSENFVMLLFYMR